ncbi:MAG: nitroreductase [Bacteroidetes bacterium]|nr:nitroreductase [Bacteroidota bacterium]
MEYILENKTADITETFKTIFERRAVRKYKGMTIDKNIILKIIEAGTMAPSAINKQPWKFYVLTNKAMIKTFSKEIASVALKGFFRSAIKDAIKTAVHLLRFSKSFNFHVKEDPIFHGAPVVIFITGPHDNEWSPMDIGMCAQNMMLAAKSINLDTCPVGLGKFVEDTRSYPKLMIPKSEHVYLSIILGYGDENPEFYSRKKDNIRFIDP